MGRVTKIATTSVYSLNNSIVLFQNILSKPWRSCSFWFAPIRTSQYHAFNHNYTQTVICLLVANFGITSIGWLVTNQQGMHHSNKKSDSLNRLYCPRFAQMVKYLGCLPFSCKWFFCDLKGWNFRNVPQPAMYPSADVHKQSRRQHKSSISW